MNNDIANSSSGWMKIKIWVAGLTAVLLVVPALINAGVDIYKSLLNVPRTRSEQINADLFRKYFNTPPIVAVPVPIKTMHGTVNMKLSIYESGDIFAEYGNYSQWFPFPSQPTGSLSLVTPAYAQPPVSPDRAGEYRQKDTLKGNKIEREQIYSDGRKETYTIDPNTGEIRDKTITHEPPPPPADSEPTSIRIIEFQTIDIEALKQKKKPPVTP